MSKKSSALANRIKRMMQADEDVGKISQQTPMIIAHAMELFLEQLAKGSSEVATARGDKTLHTAHLKDFVMKTPSMDFLKEIVAKAPELKEKATSPSSKRQRKSDDNTEKPTRKKAKGSQKEQGSKKPAAKRGKKTEKEQAITSEADTSGEQINQQEIEPQATDRGTGNDQKGGTVSRKEEPGGSQGEAPDRERKSEAASRGIAEENEGSGNGKESSTAEGTKMALPDPATSYAVVEEDDYDAE